MDIEQCIVNGYLKRIKPDKKLVRKELSSSKYDLERSKSSLSDGDYKWAIIQAYYSIFHASRALLFSIGLREKRHFAIGIVLEDLSENKKINPKLVTDFQAAISAREDADYRDVYSQETAEYLVEIAKEFLKSIKRYLRDEGYEL